MVEQLLLSKRLFQEGERFCKGNDPISAGLAISHFQDSIEILIWSIAKTFNVQVPEKDGFQSLFDKVNKAVLDSKSITLPCRCEILELNKARVNFKHYGILPDISQGSKYRGYTDSFLRTSFDICFQKDFDRISMSDLISSDNIKQHIKKAEEHFINKEYRDCINEIAKARNLLLNSIKTYVPDVDSNLKKAHSLFDRQVSSQARDVFKYIYDYLNVLRSTSIINACDVSMKDFNRFESNLPCVSILGDGYLQINRTKIHHDTEEDAEFSLQFIINLALKIQNLT